MCYCNPTFDVRYTCWITNNDGTKNKDFKRCPVRCETTYWRIMNEYKYYKMIEENGFDSIEKEILAITCLNENDWKSIKEFYEKDLIDE
tara:strand:+ start:725 stop:991 length:267 start_codon:yes stop_codon:yes gene_type:complete